MSLVIANRVFTIRQRIGLTCILFGMAMLMLSLNGTHPFRENLKDALLASLTFPLSLHVADELQAYVKREYHLMVLLASALAWMAILGFACYR